MRLTAVERRWARSVLDTLFPGPARGELPRGAGEMDVAGYFERTFAAVPFESSMGLRVTLWIIALSPLFVIGRLATFPALAVEARERVLSALLSSRVYLVRGLVAGLKAVASLLYCGDPLVRARLLTPAAAPLVALRLGAEKPSTEGAGREHRFA